MNCVSGNMYGISTVRAVARLSAVGGQRGGNRKYVFLNFKIHCEKLENFQ